ncbi:hypothetical protein A2642_04510 [Candidatus Nomurabacteria bacterium RIFCSPHIGHO2_01_FULL_39_10]|uniref:SpoVT-AbrB domain-containing protein n=1 Tax=Candidatus Nomurabacteria bacterium RIFCSPHIGHO2_01_FULL_39_10 TaxID=1801733 RepID=A0A1F6V775_9BACT|nr:MAG: hypothetical protein A2642_04510 [Candidatus Nomurabacteria bacterium RIFCSPHIGHO2_01_FULL_39_10]
MTSQLVKLGPKGQILINKEYREKMHLRPGNYLKTILTPQGLLLKPFNAKKEMEHIRKIREEISKHLPKNFDSVHAAREVRR